MGKEGNKNGNPPGFYYETTRIVLWKTYRNDISTVHSLCIDVFFSWLRYMLHEKRSKTIYDKYLRMFGYFL